MGKAGIDPEKNPLAFLDRLLEDERDSNLHFGDVRFWRHLEYIDTAQIYRTKSLEYRTMKLMFCEAVFYIMFLGVLTGYIINMRSSDVFESRRQQFDYWAGCDQNANGNPYAGSCNFFNIKAVPEIMEWIRTDLTPKTFTDKTLYPPIVEASSIFRLHEGTMAWAPRYVADTKTTILIGAVRIRQLRVMIKKGEDCPILEEFQNLDHECYPAFSEGVQSTLPWAPTWTPEHLRHHYDHRYANYSKQTTTKGYHGVYPGDGFYFDLPLNLSGAQERLTELEQWEWVDKRTRAVIIEFSTLNPNVNVFVHNRMLIEIPVTGGVMSKFEVSAFRVFQLSLSLMMGDNLELFILASATVALHILLFAYVCFMIKQNGLKFFTYFWGICDLIILTLFVILICVNIAIFAKASGEPNLAPEVIGDPEMFFPIGVLVPDLELATDILAVLGLFAWLKILKYFALIGFFQAFVRVVERSVGQLLKFAGLLFIVLFGFAVAFHMLYSPDLARAEAQRTGEDFDRAGNYGLFSTLGGAFVACIVAPAGGVNFDSILARGDFFGAVLVFMYIVLTVFLLLKTFMAIVVDTYSVITYEMGEVKRVSPHNPTLIFLWTYFNALKNVKLVGRETEEDKGDPHEQQIVLSSLPEAISERYKAKKREMLDLRDSAQSQIDQEKMFNLIRATGLPLPPPTTSNAVGFPELKAIEGGPQMLPLEDVKNGNGNGGGSNPPPPPPPPAADDAEDPHQMVNRVQLQRMLDEDPELREICQTTKAIDIVRRFRVDQSSVDPYEAVARLQAAVAKELQGLEEKGMHLQFDEIETLRTVSSELHNALTESQKEWRSELLSVMQMASLLSKALIELTRKLEQVQRNHNALDNRVRR
mmetsp:Transcript_140544/g.262162  ORF Transcript_140544/g.262162 Transcript_140544/m.262162 type:complete len:871 (+) Transcript_140544:150-2762(+)